MNSATMTTVWIALLMSGSVILFVLWHVIAAECLRLAFGDDYRAYKARTAMFLPRLFGRANQPKKVYR